MRFALTFDGYAHYGSFERCASLANAASIAYRQNRELPTALTRLRNALFFEQRRWRHFDSWPPRKDMRYIRALAAAIGAKVQSGN
ncbi:MAG: hypothetical protein HYR51_00180 [Candidatus Rokubacteria bacterium]|nr:hypothetical protein [Candidatus Rokubacteria bacterium]